MDKFRAFIDKTGQSALAEALGVSRTTVYCWRRGKYRPSIVHPSMVHRIIDLSEGELELEDIRPDIFESEADPH